MQNPQGLPLRTIAFATDDVDELAAAQPERRRRYEQLQRGRLHGELTETSWGSAALLRERWSCGVRVRCDPPGGYVGYAVLTWTEGDVRLSGRLLEPGAIVRNVGPWELTSSGPPELLCFGVAGDALARFEAMLAGGEPPPPRDRWTPTRDDGRLAGRLLHHLRLFDPASAEPAARAAVEAYLVRLAAGLDRTVLAPVERLPPASRRRAAVRRIEEYLDASPGEVPSIPTLCAVAGVSERTLEYAFREHLGTTPIRFLKLWRLNRIRRELLAAAPGATVTEIALRAGAYELGRFAGEYREHFGELPSRTLRRTTAGRASRVRVSPESGSGHADSRDRWTARPSYRRWRSALR